MMTVQRIVCCQPRTSTRWIKRAIDYDGISRPLAPCIAPIKVLSMLYGNVVYGSLHRVPNLSTA